MAFLEFARNSERIAGSVNKTVDEILIKNPVICLKFIFAFIKFRQIESDHIVFSFGGPRGLHLKILNFLRILNKIESVYII